MEAQPTIPKDSGSPGTISPTKSSLLCALIMAGGSGERFWPLSTPQRPKQLLSLFSDKSMIRETVDRILPLIQADKIFVATNILQAEEIKKELPDIPHANIIVEPAFKDTAAAIGYSTLIIDERFKDLKVSHQRIEVVVLASDHLIQKSEEFRRALTMAADEAKRSEVIVLLGIKPDKPETGYGYIEVADNIPLNTIAKVRRFREKPNFETAETYLASGKHYWNSGMFIFSIDTIFNNFRVLMEDHHETFKQLRKVVETGATGEALSKLAAPYFQNFEKISIDYGIMELSTNKRVILVDIGWSDIGSFSALRDVFPEDQHKNVVLPGTEVLSQDSSENIVIAPGSLVSLLGVEHLIIAKNGDNILIAHRDRGQDIKKIVTLYNQRLINK